MAILLAVLGVGFPAFCVWLTVRFINRRERWAKWTLAGVALGLLVGYLLSWPWSVPVVHGRSAPPWLETTADVIYRPLMLTIDNSPEWVTLRWQNYCFKAYEVMGLVAGESEPEISKQ